MRNYFGFVPKIIAVLIYKQSLQSYKKVSYLQKNNKWYNFETTFQNKVNFSQQIRLI